MGVPTRRTEAYSKTHEINSQRRRSCYTWHDGIAWVWQIMWWFSYNTYVIDDRQVWTYRGKMCVLWRITDYVKDGPIKTDGHNTFVLPWSDDDTADDTWTERRLVVYVTNGSLCNCCNTGNMWLGYTHVGGKRVEVPHLQHIRRYMVGKPSSTELQ